MRYTVGFAGKEEPTLEKSLVCIGCPLGCRLMVAVEGCTVRSVSGNACKRGAAYAQQEAVMPLRVLTGNMKARGCRQPFSVITDKPVPKHMLLACAAELRRHCPTPPISMGDIIIKDILETGCNVIATQECPATLQTDKK